MTEIYFLTIKEVMDIHDYVISKYGGLSGIHDLKLLESAIYHPQTNLFGKFVYKNIFEMSAAYCFHLIKNHPFKDGNKRTGILVTLTFMKKNGFKVNIDFDALYDFALNIAASKIDKKEITLFLKKNSVKIQK